MDRKAMLRHYKQTPRPAGLFVVRNAVDGTVLVGLSTDLPGMLNRQRFQLDAGSHPDKALQSDWDRLGPDAFAIEVLDELEPRTDKPDHDSRDDLAALRDMWIEKLTATGAVLYPFSTRGT